MKHTICPGSANEGTTATIAPLDVNGDGSMDLLTGRYLFLNKGKGASWTNYDIGTATKSNSVHDSLAVDIDGSGRVFHIGSQRG